MCAHPSPNQTPLRTFHQLPLFAGRSALPNPCSRRANLTFCTCLLAQGWQSTPMVSILNKRSCCWVLQLRSRSDFGRLVLAGSKSRWVLTVSHTAKTKQGLKLEERRKFSLGMSSPVPASPRPPRAAHRPRPAPPPARARPPRPCTTPGCTCGHGSTPPTAWRGTSSGQHSEPTPESGLKSEDLRI